MKIVQNKAIANSRPRGWFMSVIAAITMLLVGVISGLPATATAAEVEEIPGILENLTPESRAIYAEINAQIEENNARAALLRSATETVRGPIKAPASDLPLYGWGFEWDQQIGDAYIHWLGAMNPGSGFVEWCRNFDSLGPAGTGSRVNVSPTPRAGISHWQVANNYEMGYILNANANRDPNTMNGEADLAIYNAAVSAINHLSYESGNGVNYLNQLIDTLSNSPNGRLIGRWMTTMIQDARENAGPPTLSAKKVVADNGQDFSVTDVGVRQKPNNNWIGGVTVSVTITSGNGVFNPSQVNGTVSSDGLTWTGKTITGPLSLTGRSTANGNLTTIANFSDVVTNSVQGVDRSNGTQDTIVFYESKNDPSFNEGTPLPIVYDFQPMLTSSTANAGFAQVAAGTTTIKDELTVFSDPDYPQTDWLGVGRTSPLEVDYKPLKVTFKGTAYKLDAPLSSPLDTVPSNAVKVAETTIVADGPGVYTAEADYSGDTGYITWVWELDKDDQPEIAESDKYMIAGNWSDQFGLADETTTIMDFQPMLTSSTDGADSKVVLPGTKVLKDELTVFADPNYKWTDWLGSGSKLPTDAGYKPLPVKFKGTAYAVGEVPVAESNTVPAGAKKVAETSIIANGPGKYTATANYNGDPQFVTWVWEVDKADQPQLSADELKMIHDNWSDSFGVAAEQTSVGWPGMIESNVKIHTTNTNTYLVDDVWVSMLPETHPDFNGGYTFGPDTKTIQQNLYFWPGKTKEEVTSLSDAQLIGTVNIPAKNGFYPSVGGLQFKIVRDSNDVPVMGTYQFVHEFAGDDRVGAFVSQIPDYDEMFEVLDGPQIETTATGSVDSMVGAYEDVTITDEVCYINLEKGKEYELNGVLMDKETGKPLLVDGKEVAASKKFTPSNSIGCETIEFTFNASGLEGKTTVVFEKLYKDGKEVAVHADIEDKGQTVDIPKIGTKASGAVENLVGAFENVTLTDTVSYEKLTPGKVYTLTGVLMDKETGKPLLVDGKEVTASKNFRPSNSKGTEDLEFTFNASALEGKTVVVFEDVYVDGIKIATHADIEDEDQTVYIPKIGTKATGTADSMVGAFEDVTITDTVSYEKLIPGKEYTVSGVLMDKETGKPFLVEGKEVTASKEFTPEEPSGTVDLEFTFNASGLEGKTVVVFEDAYVDGIKIATHADIEDEDQTVYIPKVATTATGENGGKDVYDKTDAIVKDNVCYQNLVPGKEYTISGKLMVKETNKPLLVNGKEVTASKKFTAKEAKGCEELEFKFNASALTGQSLVVFEDMFHGDVLIATHSDINDKDQTVKITTSPKKPVTPTGTNTGLSLAIAGIAVGIAGGALLITRRRFTN